MSGILKRKIEEKSDELKDKKKSINLASGITLIALVITVIVLLILAGVSIVTLSGENGIISRTQSAIEKTKIAEAEEQANLMLTDKLIGVMSNVSGEHGEIGIASILSELKTEGYIENYGTTGETTIKISSCVRPTFCSVYTF